MPDGCVMKFNEDAGSPCLILIQMHSSPMVIQTSITYQTFWEFHGKIQRQSPSPMQSHTWASHGTSKCRLSQSHQKRKGSTSTQSRAGPHAPPMSSRTCKSCMESCCMPPSWSQWVELTLQTWKPCSAPSMAVLSFHTMHRTTLQMTSSGGKAPSHLQSSLVPSQDHPSSFTSKHIPMPALVLALLSPLATNGKHGASSLVGSQTTVTSLGQRQLVLSSLFKCSSCLKHQEPTSKSMATTGESLKASRKAKAGTGPPTQSFAGSTSSQSLAAALSIPAMSQVNSTLLTIHHEASTPQSPSSSLHSPSQVNSHPSSQILIQAHHSLNSTLIRAVLHLTHTQNPPVTTPNPHNTVWSAMNLGSGTRSKSVKQKMSDRHGSRDNSLPPTPMSPAPPAYSINLTPQPSPLHPHCIG
jgi:hypothetical protein